MSAAKKYQFAEAFDGGQSSETETALAEAQQDWETQAQARETAAFEAGKAEALAALEAQTLAQVQAMNAQLLALAGEREALEKTVSDAAVELAELATFKIADILIERGPGRLVAETVLKALPLVIGEARIVVRLAEALVDHIKSRMDEMALEAGFTGKVVLLGDESIAPGDCRIEWANGGIERRAQQIKHDISAAIQTSLAEHDGVSSRAEAGENEETQASASPQMDDAPMPAASAPEAQTPDTPHEETP
ncbi:MAG: FliH/SctL family protein [Pseudomonadota bacterium]